MDSKAVWAAARAQLALDLGCDPALLDSPDNEAVLWQDRKGRRMYCADTPFLELAVWNGKLIASCRPSLLSWIRENLLPCQAEWLFLPRNFRRLEAGLAPFGYELGDARHFYLPVLPCDFFLGAYPFACFIIEHAACGYLDVRLRKQFSFAEDKVDMIVCLAFVVVEG